MSIEALKEQIPDYAKDIRLNVGSLLNETILTDQQKWGAVLAAAHAVGVPSVVKAAEADAAARLSPEAIAAAKAAAAIMAMNNVYYRALHIMANKEYETLRAGLRMNVIGSPGVDKGDFEFWCTVVSAINGCGRCLDAHEEELKKRGWTAQQIQAGIRLGAVINAASAVLRAEAALAG
jgi:lipoyl-dependent peroxiredoxin subunit D